MNAQGYYNCGLSDAMTIIGRKWTIGIIYSLESGPKRFGDLQDGLKINPRTLSLRLQQLEENKIIKRQDFAGSPPKVEYSLTQKGRSLHKIIRLMCDWGAKKAN